ncbi:hypothetical protein JCGZ_05264 [Jatropha curcas]|uniref:VQ domain-containing protein n=1 Tax=Jatropha curcas TaxID=180498 RepID=A0A067J9F0_JATCU|nr:VQ motif-containing protein 25 [Jatropha curcas]KDP20381.1 hypothetical protein JCGZ_05264 [Jatropha curcas]
MELEDIIMSPNVSAPSPKLAMHRDSHVISKFKPKVRIIHIFAPEIIKTDVANFRELVQRLTGKPGDQESNSNKKKKKKARNNTANCSKKALMMQKKNKKGMQLQDMSPTLIQCEEKLKMEEENGIWGSSTESSSSFLDGFADFNGFIHDSTDNFSLPPNSLFSSHGFV